MRKYKHGDVEGPGEGDEVVGGELSDPVAGDGALGVGHHRLGPFLPGHGGELAGRFGLGKPPPLAQPARLAATTWLGVQVGSTCCWPSLWHRAPVATR